MASRGAVIVFARADSRRLPGKALLDIAGRPLLGRALHRLRRLRPRFGPPVVATSDRPVDDAIAAFAAAEDCLVHRGPAADVAARALGCAEALDLDWFLRISGDSPFIDPAVAEQVIALGETRAADIASNVFPRSFPAGCSAERVATAALRRALDETDDPDHREHVTGYFYARPDRFRIVNLSSGHPEWAAASVAVDTPEDLARARMVAARIDDDAPIDAVIAAFAAVAAETEGRS